MSMRTVGIDGIILILWTSDIASTSIARPRIGAMTMIQIRSGAGSRLVSDEVPHFTPIPRQTNDRSMSLIFAPPTSMMSRNAGHEVTDERQGLEHLVVGNDPVSVEQKARHTPEIR